MFTPRASTATLEVVASPRPPSPRSAGCGQSAHVTSPITSPAATAPDVAQQAAAARAPGRTRVCRDRDSLLAPHCLALCPREQRRFRILERKPVASHIGGILQQRAQPLVILRRDRPIRFGGKQPVQFLIVRFCVHVHASCAMRRFMHSPSSRRSALSLL